MTDKTALGFAGQTRVRTVAEGLSACFLTKAKVNGFRLGGLEHVRSERGPLVGAIAERLIARETA